MKSTRPSCNNTLPLYTFERATFIATFPETAVVLEHHHAELGWDAALHVDDIHD
jgi:hypothetical protein